MFGMQNAERRAIRMTLILHSAFQIGTTKWNDGTTEWAPDRNVPQQKFFNKDFLSRTITPKTFDFTMSGHRRTFRITKASCAESFQRSTLNTSRNLALEGLRTDTVDDAAIWGCIVDMASGLPKGIWTPLLPDADDTCSLFHVSNQQWSDTF